MDDSDLDSNYLSENEYDEYDSSYRSSSQHSTQSLERHRNEMNLDDNDNDDTNQRC